MKIACLGWGSLIWDPRSLPIYGSWFVDGPLLPIEFARESGRKRITLVIADVEDSVRSMWALMSVSTLGAAKSKLAEREEISEGNIKYSIGYWDRTLDSTHGMCAAEIGAWAITMNLDAVAWTNLKFGFKNNRGTLPEYGEILSYIENLDDGQRQVVEEYMCRAPLQVDTEFRRNLQRDLGWKPIGA